MHLIILVDRTYGVSDSQRLQRPRRELLRASRGPYSRKKNVISGLGNDSETFSEPCGFFRVFHWY